MFRFRIITYTAAILWLSGCTLPTRNDGSTDWDNINYAKIACGEGKSTRPGCKAEGSAIISGGGHHGGHK